jgi:hypothetical protein
MFGQHRFIFLSARALPILSQGISLVEKGMLEEDTSLLLYYFPSRATPSRGGDGR